MIVLMVLCDSMDVGCLISLIQVSFAVSHVKHSYISHTHTHKYSSNIQIVQLLHKCLLMYLSNYINILYIIIYRIPTN